MEPTLHSCPVYTTRNNFDGGAIMSKALLATLAAGALALAACNQSAEGTPADEVAASSASPAPSAPAPSPSRTMVTVPEGTIVSASLQSKLSSGTNHVGDNFSAQVNEPVMINGHEAIPAGATIHGTVTAVTPAKRGAGRGSMSLGFDRLELPGGYSTTMVAGLSQESASKKGRNAAIIGGSAAGGSLLGRVLGKDTKGAVIGAIVGGGIGTGVVMSKEGEQVNLPAGYDLPIRLDASLKVPAR